MMDLLYAKQTSKEKKLEKEYQDILLEDWRFSKESKNSRSFKQ